MSNDTPLVSGIEVFVGCSASLAGRSPLTKDSSRPNDKRHRPNISWSLDSRAVVEILGGRGVQPCSCKLPFAEVHPTTRPLFKPRIRRDPPTFSSLIPPVS